MLSSQEQNGGNSPSAAGPGNTATPLPPQALPK